MSTTPIQDIMMSAVHRFGLQPTPACSDIAPSCIVQCQTAALIFKQQQRHIQKSIAGNQQNTNRQTYLHARSASQETNFTYCRQGKHFLWL